MSKITAFLNMKGGVAKTTSSLNLAVGFANKGKRVLLIDFDPQANSTDILLNIQQNEIYINEAVKEAINDKNPKALDQALKDLNSYEYNELFIDQMLLDSTLTTTYQSSVENLHVIPSRLELANVEREIRNSNEAIHNRLKKIIREIQSEYDYIFIDCPPIINTLTINVLNVVDEIIAPIKIDRGAEKGLIMTIRELLVIAESYMLEIIIRPLFTMVPRNNTAKERIEILSGFQNSIIKPIEATVRYQDKPVSQASYDNEIVINNKNANVGQDYVKVVEYLEGEWN